MATTEVKFMEQCDSCNGTGNRHVWQDESGKIVEYARAGCNIKETIKGGCRWCNGKGQCLTTEGSAVLDMLDVFRPTTEQKGS